MFEICKLYYEFSSPEEMGLHHDIPTITFRGAFGYALAQVIARDGCIPELRSQVKLYKQFFMPQNDGLCDSRNLDLARPFILRGFYSRPDKCSFILEVSLFGIAIEYESFFDRVVEVMSYMGIGKNRTVCHYEKLNKVYLKPTLPEVTDLLQVFFLTPCVRLKHKGQIFEENGKQLTAISRFTVFLPNSEKVWVELPEAREGKFTHYARVSAHYLNGIAMDTEAYRSTPMNYDKFDAKVGYAHYGVRNNEMHFFRRELKMVLGMLKASKENYRSRKIGSIALNEGQKLDAPWTALTSGSTGITAAAGTPITVAEIDGKSRVIKRGEALSVPKAAG